MRSRIIVLDSLRGLAACMVALVHFPFAAEGHLLWFASHSNVYLYTDYFFVLSGYVIARSYQEPMRAGMPAWRFLVLRFGRLYPLHFAILAFYVLRGGLLEFAASAGVTINSLQLQPEDVRRMVGYAGLLQDFPAFLSYEWNVPCWTLSAEFYTYVVFSGLVALFGQRLLAGLAGMGLMCTAAFWLILAPPGPQIAELYIQCGVLRSIGAFSIGAIAWNLQRAYNPNFDWRHETSMVLAFAAVALFCSEKTALLVGPFLCAALICVLVRESGPIARVLQAGPLRLLGALSFSIYMLHTPLTQLAFDLASVLNRLVGAGIDLGTSLTQNPWAGDLIAVGYLAVIVAVSVAAQRWIEAPARRWFRGIAGVEWQAHAADQFQPALAVAYGPGEDRGHGQGRRSAPHAH